MKILAIDLGMRRVGLAISDNGVIASLPVLDILSRQSSIQEILQIIRNENINKIVIGLPKGTPQEDMVRSFAMEVNKSVDIPIDFEDETLTSKEAERLLSGMKIDPKSTKYKEEIDRISAKLILEQYIKN